MERIWKNLCGPQFSPEFYLLTNTVLTPEVSATVLRERERVGELGAAWLLKAHQVLQPGHPATSH